jgi:transcriptional regulator with XRE-family HTH domain
VAEPESSGRKRKTALREARETIGVRQEEMAERTGIPLRTYQRLESGGLANPPIRYLVNCALTLTLELAEVCEPEWLAWLPTEHAAQPTPLSPNQAERVGWLRHRRESNLRS